MIWLKENAYLAAWLSPVITLIGIVIQNSRVGVTAKVNWSKAMIYVGFLTSLAVTITPGAEWGPIRIGVTSVGGLCLGWILIDAGRS
jgi:hypothetical protein